MNKLKITNKTVFGIFAILTLCLLPRADTFAISERQLAGNLITEVSPDHPGAHTKVMVTLVSFALDLNRSIVSWSIDGETKLTGVAKNKLEFTTKGPGTRTTVIVRALAPDGTEHAKELVFIPGDIDLVWETNTYTPPTYKGKALLTSGGTVRFIALPILYDNTGKRVATDLLSYDWSRDYEKLRALSGYGKDVAEFGGFTTLKNTVISVVVRDLESGNSVESSVAIKAGEPTLRFYEESPLAGTRYERAVSGNYSMPGAEATLRAEPYHLPLSVGQRPTFRWTIGGLPAQADQANPRLITLRQEASGAGTAELACNVEGEVGSVKSALSVLFGSRTSVF
ncbi:MAG: hypothetical protein COV10_03880 [Candidatus Vogelbacteria bacterium CG10_big_fil_rev_8_21_14_0_10_51_16]|uniref:Uncharacterized protein n=1 Tax=Candidatus Vogelbacteria bacterium CG10_big_fil_rev_8_21_14_0_10_51_16 TaxID=1975045 RepID=A0A2H0RF10_9BACT|nr:MAG: hypothetical protein COV10_03880 [Candidatus Vogelbacteria bacterium CG10_big_fil_rev_8_21_14_0_10_51_16]